MLSLQKVAYHGVMMRALAVLTFSTVALLAAGVVAAQEQPGNLPPLPPPSSQPPPYQPAPAAQPYQPPPSQPVYAAPPPPPPVVYIEPPSETHAPKYSLWTGARLGFLGYGGHFFDYPTGPNTLETETSGNFISNGLALQLDVGARIARRYIPYVGLELGGVKAGHRFDGTGATAGTQFIGIGFRYTGGDVDEVGFVSDLSFGFR